MAGLAEVLAGAEAVVVGNTGPAHLAAAVGTPVVSLFAPVVPAVRWRPWGVRHVLLGDQEAACAGSRARVCPLPGHPCLDAVPVEEVVAAVGTPVVSLFAPVVPAVRWRPWGVPHLLLGDQAAACAGSRARVCPVPGHPCLSRTAPADVVAAVRRLGEGRRR